MNEYSDANPPKKGTAKKIYDAFKAHGWKVKDLHYNPNCWGNTDGGSGWGSWACEVHGTPYGTGDIGGAYFFCGVQNGLVYMRQLNAPFRAWVI